MLSLLSKYLPHLHFSFLFPFMSFHLSFLHFTLRYLMYCFWIFVMCCAILKQLFPQLMPYFDLKITHQKTVSSCVNSFVFIS